MVVCLKCGDKGDMKYLVYCIKCKVSAEHRYCLDTMPGKGDKNVIWTCEECVPRDAKPSPRPSIKSEHINQAVETRLNRITKRRQMNFSLVNVQGHPDAESFTNANQPTDDSCLEEEEIERLSSSHESEIEDFRKRKRRFVLEDGSSDEESESVKCTESVPSQLVNDVNAYSLDILPASYSETNQYIHAQPVLDPIWRGSLSIQNRKNPTVIGIVAHLSTKACEKVKNAVKELPLLLNMRIYSRSDAWPLKFQIEPPTDESIALYLFPEQERDEKLFDDLMNDMIIHDQALRAVLNTVELFVYSSRELPPDHWRFCRKYYLWGVFKPTNLSCSIPLCPN